MQSAHSAFTQPSQPTPPAQDAQPTSPTGISHGPEHTFGPVPGIGPNFQPPGPIHDGKTKVPCKTNQRYPVSIRIQALSLMVAGHPWHEIHKWTGMGQMSQSRLRKKAAERGFRPEQDSRIFEHYVNDGVRLGRPNKATVEARRREAELNGLATSGPGDLTATTPAPIPPSETEE